MTPEVLLVRHGQTEWSRDGRHTGRTDIDLTAAGERQAQALAPWVAELAPDVVLCSPRTRAEKTAALAGLVPYQVDDDLQEWDYGELEGLTTPEIQETVPGWSVWGGPWRGGETAQDVRLRADRLIARVRALAAPKAVLVGHGHFSRVLAARWVGESVVSGRWLDLDTATWSHLGWDRGVPVIRHWNVPAAS